MLRVLMTAYSCAPDTGSEPGIGWNIVRKVAREHSVVAITRANNRAAIEAALRADPAPDLTFVYWDLPRWARWWKRGTRGLQAYYYLWQIGVYLRARSLHRREPFDLAHHVTFGRYWNPSFLPWLGIPFLWGPVGGGESSPPALRRGLGLRGRAYEWLRDLARGIGERDPFVRATARRCALAFSTTEETARRLRALGVGRVVPVSNAALDRAEIRRLATLPDPPPTPFRFVSMGRALHWKGFHLALRAFARAELPREAEYWVIGEGPALPGLRALARELGVEHRTRFFGRLTREQTLERLGECHALLHPSLHDSGGWVCIEAMAAGRPVLCLDAGGPSLMVDASCGYAIPPGSVETTIDLFADAMTRLHAAPDLRRAMSRAAVERAERAFTWEARVARILEGYDAVAGAASSASATAAV